MLDWLTLHCPYDKLPGDAVADLRLLFDRVARYDPLTGETKWDIASWDSIRSDSHALAIRAGSDKLHIQCSPARIMCDGDNTFGHPEYHSNIKKCAMAMIRTAQAALAKAAHERGLKDWNLVLPTFPSWECKRIDITYNYVLPTLENVREALSHLRGVEGGRYRVSAVAGDTVYWAKTSRRRKGKAYAKGPHLRYLIKKGKLGFEMNADQLQHADRLLRLEMTIMSQWLRDQIPHTEPDENGHTRALKWWELTPDHLQTIHGGFFDEMIGTGEVPMTDTKLQTRVYECAPSEGQGKAAWATFMMIRAQGWEETRNMLPKSTWYRHRSILKAAGLSDGDLSHGRVIPLRRSRVLDLRPATNWQELMRA